MPEARRPAALDHCVLPVADLAVARAWLTALGFTVAPEGVHPFGTSNACVYFADDSFIEPLAIHDGDIAAAQALAGNVFVSRDATYRSNAGEGFSAVVLATSDADFDHARFREAGISAGDRLDFSRGYVDAAGNARAVSFRLAFAAPENRMGTFFFTCERVDAPEGGRGSLATHENGVSGIARVVATAPEPRRLIPFFRDFTGVPPRDAEAGLLIETQTAPLLVLDPARFEKEMGTPVDDDDFALAAIVYATPDVEAVEALLRRSDIRFHSQSGRLVVPPVAGQGAIFIFEENR